MLKLSGLFSEGAVLQRDRSIPVWGWSAPHAIVDGRLGGVPARTRAGSDGRFLLRFPPRSAGGPHVLTVSADGETVEVTDLLVGEVWVAGGQSNMEFPVDRDTTSRWKNAMSTVKQELQNADYPEMRFFRVEHQLSPDAPLDDCVGTWEVCSPATAARFSAVGFVFGRKIHNAIHQPVGLIQSTWGGTHAESWTRKEAMQGDYYERLRADQQAIIANLPAEKERYAREMSAYKAALEANPDTALKAPAKVKRLNDNLRMSTLWNAMINPILPYTIKGVIWYQGESNDSRPADYEMVFANLIHSWRAEWKQGDFPFYFVQIAPYRKQSPTLREGQLRVWQKVPNTGMAVITDAGDSTNIHPRNKVIPGERLAFWALSHDYGFDVPYMGPVYKSMKVNGSVVELTFDYVGSGLDSKGEPLRGFVIAGRDGIFYPARAVIKGDKVEVSSPQVASPVAVRYGWDKFFRVNLYNREGLPATPFRTDNWKL